MGPSRTPVVCIWNSDCSLPGNDQGSSWRVLGTFGDVVAPTGLQTCVAQDVGHLALQRLGDPNEAVYCDVLFAAFDQAYVITVAFGEFCKPFLGYPEVIPACPDGRADILAIGGYGLL